MSQLKNDPTNKDPEARIELSSTQNDLQIIIEQAVCDEKFRKDLLSNPDSVLDNYQISDVSKLMIKSLSKEDYDKLTLENITEYFSADSAIYTPDFDSSVDVLHADEDDI